MTMYDDPDTAPGGHDQRAEEQAQHEYDRDLADRYDEILAGIEMMPKRRHVLIVEPSGVAYVATHQWPVELKCGRLAYAAIPFLEDQVPESIEPGRYWVDVLDDGNLAIGGRISD